jgi:pimeloyl-ACP methyl ester carboxylesterase
MARVVASDGVELYAETHGEGVPLLLSGALCTTRENYRSNVEPLVAAGAQVVLWDYRGHGRSESPDDPSAYSLDHVIDDLGRVLDWAAPGRPAIVGGLSFGGLASLHFAHRNPARVCGLLLIDSGPGFKNPEAQAAWEASVEKTASYVEAKGCAAFVAGRAAVTLIGTQPDLPAARVAAEAIAEQNPIGLAHFARQVAALAPPVIDELPQIAAPALVVIGENDKPYLRAAEVMTARLPNARRLGIPGAGHIVNIEAASEFEAAAAEFVGRIAAA